jgi:pilus assembly protein CpaB
MKTQWVVASLVVLGLLAAVSAAILVAAMHFGARAPGPAAGPAEQAAFVVAARPLPAMAIVDTSCVTIKTAPRDQVPKDVLPSPDSVLGKVLISPLVEGQAFTSSCFAAEGTGPQLAGKLPNGMRAVMVPLPEHSSLEGLLYPGSIVDVLATLRTAPAGAPGGGEMVSTTFLPGVEVLAVDYQTVFSEEPKASSTAGAAIASRRERRVTLMVNQEQAKALRLAMEQGTVSLALRNPLDRDPGDRRVVGINDIVASPAATPAAGPLLARKLPNGMRAVMVPLPEHSSLEGLLYPGSIVDVLASLRRTTPSGAQTASLTGMDIGKMDVNNMDVNKMNFKIQTGIERFSTTLLSGVEVLAVDYQTVFSEEPNASPATGTTARRLHLVTLMLNQEQAKALQQAMEQGTVSLVLRNPEDRDPENRRAVGVLDVSVIRGGGQETELFEVNTGQKGTGRR